MQNEVGTKDSCGFRIFLHRKCSENLPEFLEPQSCKSKNSRKVILPNFAPRNACRKSRKIGDQCDWTTGDRGAVRWNEWRKCCVAPCGTLCVPVFFLPILNCRSRSKRAFGLPGATTTWDHFRCAVESSSGHIQCRKSSPTSFCGGRQTHIWAVDCGTTPYKCFVLSIWLHSDRDLNSLPVCSKGPALNVPEIPAFFPASTGELGGRQHQKS